MNKEVGIISSIDISATPSFQKKEELNVTNKFGNASLIRFDGFIWIPRHGQNPSQYILPHVINHQANLQALKDLNIQDVIGICSVGSLTETLTPGTIIIPHDYISLAAVPTVFLNEAIHIIPVLNEEIRTKLLTACRRCKISTASRGIYWQSSGPRLETKAEIAMCSHFADIIGMTMASEATVAQEIGLSYAAICSIDNYAHGLSENTLLIEDISKASKNNAQAMMKIMYQYIQNMRDCNV